MRMFSKMKEQTLGVLSRFGYKKMLHTIVPPFFAVIVVCGAIVLYLNQQTHFQQSGETVVENTHVSVTQESGAPGLPMRFMIPLLNIDTTFEYVKLTPDGAMDAPKSQDTVAWYELGQRPGEKGTAVIAGHYGTWDTGKGSVFDQLHTIQVGDTIDVSDDVGVVSTFVVRETRSYDANADAPEVFRSDGDGSYLNIITCEGKWNPVTNTYAKRLVVFTELVVRAP